MVTAHQQPGSLGYTSCRGGGVVTSRTRRLGFGFGGRHSGGGARRLTDPPEKDRAAPVRDGHVLGCRDGRTLPLTGSAGRSTVSRSRSRIMCQSSRGAPTTVCASRTCCRSRHLQPLRQRGYPGAGHARDASNRELAEPIPRGEALAATRHGVRRVLELETIEVFRAIGGAL